MHEQTADQLRAMREETAEQLRQMREQDAEDLKQLRKQITEQMNEQLGQVRQQTVEEMRQLREQLDVMAKSVTANSAQTSPQPSYADVACTPPMSQPSNVRSLSSMRITPSSFTDTLYCTIDMSRVSKDEEDKDKAQVGKVRQAIEEEMQTKEGRQS